jgi:hypothetical protein
MPVIITYLSISNTGVIATRRAIGNPIGTAPNKAVMSVSSLDNSTYSAPPAPDPDPPAAQTVYVDTYHSIAQCICIISYSTSGTALWSAVISAGIYSIGGNGVVTDTSGNIYVTGNINGTTTTFYNKDGTTGATVTPISISGDAFIAKYSSDGFVSWVAKMAGTTTSDDRGLGIAIDSSGYLYVSGYYGNTFTAYTKTGATGATLAFTAGGSSDSFIVKYSSDGSTVEWAARQSGAPEDKGNSIATSATGNVYVTGYYLGTLLVYNKPSTGGSTSLAWTNAQDAFIAAYSSAGSVLWAARITGTGNQAGNATTVDKDGNIYVTGSYTNTATFYNGNDGTAGPTLTVTGGTDGFIAKYSPSGAVIWVAGIGGANTETMNGATTDADGNLYVCGYIGGSITLNNANTIGGGSISVTAYGSPCSIVIKYSSSGTALWGVVNGSTGQSVVYSVVTDASGNVYSTGTYSSTAAVTMRNADGGDAGYILPISSNFGAANNQITVGYTSSGTVFSVNIIRGDNPADFFVPRSIAIYGSTLYTIGTSKLRERAIVQNTGTNITYPNSAVGGTLSLANAGGNDCYIAKYGTYGNTVWAARIAGTAADQGFATTTDTAGNVLVTGYYSAALTLYNTTTAGGSTSLSFTGGTDCFIAKYSSAGSVVWAAQISGASTNSEYGNGVVADTAGNVYVGGTYTGGTVLLYNTPGVGGSTSLTLTGTQNGFIAKYSSTGSVAWAAQIACSGTASVKALSIDSAGNVYAVGTYNAALTLYNTSGVGGSTSVAYSSGNNFFLAKYSSSGSVSWAAQITGPVTADTISGVSTDSTGNVYIAGSYSAALTLYDTPSIGSSKSIAFSGTQNGFVAKYSSSGAALWGAQIGITGTNLATAVATDLNGNVYVTGSYSVALTIRNTDTTTGATLTNAGSTDIFLVKYTSLGAVTWATRMASTTADSGNGLATDASGNVYVTCYYTTNTLTIYNASIPGSSGGTLTNGGSTDSAVIKYSSVGAYLWGAKISTSGAESGTAVTVDPSGNVIATGYYTGALSIVNAA